MFKKKKKSHISIEITDYVLRALMVKGPDFQQAKVFEVELPKGVVEDTAVSDEMALFDILKTHTNQWGGKNQKVRFFVPDTTVLLKSFDHPSEVKSDKLKEYVEMEIGHSIHLPFQEPLVDVYDPTEGDGQAMLFATSSEEVYKIINLLLDAHLQPEAADIRALCNLRLLEHMELLKSDKTYLVVNWLLNELSICIYSKGQVEFLRYQSIATELSKWKGKQVANDELEFNYDGDFDEYRSLIIDQVLELDRIMNFFRFSLHKGEKSVDQIIIMGANSILTEVEGYLQENLTTPIQIIDDTLINKHFPGFKAKHASLLGLALKETD